MKMDIQDTVEMIIDQVVDGEWGDVSGDDFRRLRAENHIPDVDAVKPFRPSRPIGRQPQQQSLSPDPRRDD